jgi:membrane protein implicated in regulation of membrane protease activity
MRSKVSRVMSWLMFLLFVAGFCYFLLRSMYLQAAIFAVAALLTSEMYIEKLKRQDRDDHPA